MNGSAASATTTARTPGPAHPMVDALRNAKNLEAIVRDHGTMMRAFVDEDTTLRGEVKVGGRRDES